MVNNSKRASNTLVKFFSKKGTTPLNELSQQQLINEGYRNPYYVQPDFEKSAKDKKTLYRLRKKCRKEFSGSSANLTKSLVRPVQVTVHLHNNRTHKDGESMNFKTTHSFKSTNPELDAVLLANSMRTTVNSVSYNGKKIKYEKSN